MSTKTLICLLYCVSTFNIILSTSNSTNSTREEAEQAFNDFKLLSTQLIDDIAANIDRYAKEGYHKLQVMQLESLYTLDRKISDIKLRRSQIEENLKTWNLQARCDLSLIDLERHQKKFKQRTEQCTELAYGAITNLIKKTWDDFRLQQNGLLSCNEQSLVHCRNFAKDDSCFDFVISNIKNAQENMRKAFSLLEINFKNKFISFKLPCQDIINFEISVYPDYTLRTMSQCAETDIRNSRPKICPTLT